MADLIDRQAAIDIVDEYSDPEYFYDWYSKIRTGICNLPPAQPKSGEWQRHYIRPNVYADLCWHCSECGYYTADNWANKFKFCPNCGARMRGGTG